MAQPYDAGSKWLIQHHAPAILRLAGVTGVREWAALPGELVQSRQLPDGLVEARLEGRADPVLFLVEVEVNTYPDNRVPGELLDDVLLTYLDRRAVPEVVALVLRPKGRLAVADRAAVPSPLGWAELTARWRVVNPWELPAADFLPVADPGLAPWVPLTRVDGPPEPVLRACRAAIDRTAGGERANLLAVAQILGGLRYDEGLLAAVFGGEEAMIESPVLQRLFAKRDLQTRQKVVPDLLWRRFPEVPEDVAAGVRSVAGEDVLTDLVARAATCGSLDEFRAALPW